MFSSSIHNITVVVWYELIDNRACVHYLLSKLGFVFLQNFVSENAMSAIQGLTMSLRSTVVHCVDSRSLSLLSHKFTHFYYLSPKQVKV